MGEDRVISEPATRASFAVDGLTPRCVVNVRSPEDVVNVLKYAASHDLAVIPCRNATKLGIGNIPRRYDVALCVKEMNQVWHYEPADLTVSVEPGMKLGDFQHFLHRQRLWIPLDPPGGARSSLGGIVATNAAGPLRLSYGAPRDMVLGMRVATAQGKLIKAGGRVVKNVAGYDLPKLLIGSYGTLGVIVEISFKLFPLPAHRVTASFEVEDLESAREVRRRILNSSLGPARMVLLDSGAVAMARGEATPGAGRDFEIWVECAGSEAVIERSAKTLREVALTTNASCSTLDDDFAEAAWNRISDFSSVLGASSPRLIILKAMLPVGSNEVLVKLVREEAGREQLQHACFSQNGAGVVHVCLIPEESGPDLSAIVTTLRNAAANHGGALVIERCPVELKKRTDVWGPPRNDFGLMRKLKELWDPKGTLSPGRFVGRL